MTIRKTGDWMRARRQFNGFTFRLSAAVTGGMALDAKAIRDDVKALIYKGSAASARHPVKWAPLADATVERKRHAHPLIETGEYVESIEVMNLGRGNLGVGVRDPVMAQRGLAQEYGAQKGPGAWGGPVPARPHWRVVLAQHMAGGPRKLAVYKALAKVFGRGGRDAPRFQLPGARSEDFDGDE